MEYLPTNHTFAIFAYGTYSYFEECIQSLVGQSVHSKIIMCTSTPNELISGLSSKYNIPLYINEKSEGIEADWNFINYSATTALVSLAHQDDIYEPDYLKVMFENMNRGGVVQFVFTDYFEIQNGKRVDSSQFINLKIKKLMLSPFRFRVLQSWKWLRRRILFLGNPIGCFSVTYVKENLPETVFDSEFGSNIDWMTWEKLARRDGRFLYIPSTLMGHRMHAETTTVKIINTDSVRLKKDRAMLRRFCLSPLRRSFGSDTRIAMSGV